MIFMIRRQRTGTQQDDALALRNEYQRIHVSRDISAKSSARQQSAVGLQSRNLGLGGYSRRGAWLVAGDQRAAKRLEPADPDSAFARVGRARANRRHPSANYCAFVTGGQTRIQRRRAAIAACPH